MSNKNPNDSRIFIGLWKRTSAKGTNYLFGSEKQEVKDDDSISRWMIFHDNKDKSVRRLCRTVGSGDMENIAVLQERAGANGSFHSEGDYTLGVNQFYTEGTNQPTYTLTIGKRPEPIGS